MLPSKPPTPSEWKVLFFFFVLALGVAGILLFFITSDSPQLAAQRLAIGFGALVFGGAAWIVKKMIE